VCHRDRSDALSRTAAKGRLHDFQLHIIKAAVEEKAHQPRPYVRVAPLAYHGSLVQIHIPGKGRARRVTEVGRKFDVFHDYQAAASNGSHHTLKGFCRLSEMRKQKASVHAIVGLDFSKVRNVLGSEDGRQLVLGCLAAGEFQTALVAVDTHGLSGGSDSKRESESDGPVAAADIEAAHSPADTDSPKKCSGRRPLGAGQELQALRRGFSTQKNVAIITQWLTGFHTAFFPGSLHKDHA
jgi:hypothetical protein